MHRFGLMFVWIDFLGPNSGATRFLGQILLKLTIDLTNKASQVSE
jgi:hypothetical protein